MEYRYRIHPKDKETIVKLHANTLEITTDRITRTISYSKVMDVRLSKSRHVYSLHLEAFDYRTVVRSQSVSEIGEKIDQSHAYLTFIRVLHMNLLVHSKATYSLGFSSIFILFALSCWVVLNALLFTMEEYFDFISLSTLLVSSLLFLAGVLVLVGLLLYHWPRSYWPTHIPLKFLPSAS